MLKFQLCHLLMAKGLWKFVDGSAVLAEDASGNDREKILAEQQKALSTLVMSVSSSLLPSCLRMLRTPSKKNILKMILWLTSYSLNNYTSERKCVRVLQLLYT